MNISIDHKSAVSSCFNMCVAPSLLDLPPSVFGSVCVSLDSGAVHNWRTLVHHLNDYTIMDVRQLSIIEQRVSSTFPSIKGCY